MRQGRVLRYVEDNQVIQFCEALSLGNVGESTGAATKLEQARMRQGRVLRYVEDNQVIQFCEALSVGNVGESPGAATKLEQSIMKHITSLPIDGCDRL
jgi:hypothetical protein